MDSIKIIDTNVEFFHQRLVKPLQISSGLISEITEARARVTVDVDGREATGWGSIYLSDVWSWPEPSLTHDQRDRALRNLCEYIADNLAAFCGTADHPLELGLRLHESICHGEAMSRVPSALACAMCASPFDAAIHDAVGIALDKSAFDLYEEDTPIPSGDPHFRQQGVCAAIRRMLQRPPRPECDAWLIVSKADSLSDDVAPWVRDRGYRAFKVKTLGRDNGADVARTVEVYQAVKQFGAARPRLTVDSNEANPDAASVLEFLEMLKAADAEAFEALEYVEQPTGRDITVSRNDWRQVTRLKPVLLDEGLTGFEVLDEAVAQGWSGFALKTCKGHSFALTAAAWAHERGLLLALQDLTNPGFSAIHAALFAAHVPTLNGVELNSPQYTPAANGEWLPRLSGLLEPREGMHRIADASPIGLGSML